MAGVTFLSPQRTLPGSATGSREAPTIDEQVLLALQELKFVELQTLLTLRRMERLLPGPSDFSRRVVIPASSTKMVTIFPPNVIRKGATLYNASTGILYMALGFGATVVDCTLPIAAGGYYEVPFWHRGAITGIWSITNGNVLGTELT
jgi:hypothetical protein